jgi:hypothetical protein
VTASVHGPHCTCPRCEGFQPGNLSALKSGSRSELALAPLRAEMDAELARDYPYLDPRRRAILGDRLARLSLAWAWLARQGGIVRDAEGHVYDVADRAEKWGSRAEQILADLEAEARERDRPQDIASALAALDREEAARRG